jgi:GT2 family glycosyltransferase
MQTAADPRELAARLSVHPSLVPYVQPRAWPVTTEGVRICVVIPVHNRRDVTLQCLRSLAQSDQSGLDVRPVVVDDGSTDGTADAVRAEFPHVDIVRGNGELFFTAATNAGIRAALRQSPAYVLTINDDVIFHPQALQSLVGCAQAYPNSVVGALLLLWNEPDRVFQVAARWDTWYGGWRHRYGLTTRSIPPVAFEVEIIVGNCVLYPALVFSQAGLLNERRLPGWGDIEFTPRLRRAGWRLLVEPGARVWCMPNAEPRSLVRSGLREILTELFVDRRKPRNLTVLLLSRWYSAPDRFRGVLAFLIMLVRSALRYAGVRSWPTWPDPPAEWTKVDAART